MKLNISSRWTSTTALALTLSLAGCKSASSGLAKTEERQSATTTPHDPLEVKVAVGFRQRIKVGEPVWGDVNAALSVPGRVEADVTRLARAGTPVAGRIAELSAVEGQSVHRGQILATLNSTELSDGQFGYLKAQSQQQLAQRAAARAKQLVDAGVISLAELQRREAEYAQVSAEVTTWHDRLRVLGMSEDAVARLDRTRAVNSLSQVVASIDGMILERHVTPGQVVQPADTLFVIGDLSQVWLVADVPEQAAGMVKPGKAFKADIPALPGMGVSGRLSFVSATVNAETRTVRVRADLPNPELLFKPAMLANIALQDGAARKRLIPAGAVVREGNKDCVFVETSPDAFVLRAVTLGAEHGDMKVLESGLSEGEKIALDGAFHLNNERKRASLHGE